MKCPRLMRTLTRDTPGECPRCCTHSLRSTLHFAISVAEAADVVLLFVKYKHGMVEYMSICTQSDNLICMHVLMYMTLIRLPMLKFFTHITAC